MEKKEKKKQRETAHENKNTEKKTKTTLCDSDVMRKNSDNNVQ